MKRDLDLIRLVLLQMESADGSLELGQINRADASEASLLYHVELMEDQGLIHASILRDTNGEALDCTLKTITWTGQEYLDSVRDPRVWSRTKQALSAVGAVTLKVVEETAAMVSLALIKEQLGA